jgi:hypothetical protein
MAEAYRDENHVPTLLGVSSVDGVTPVVLWADPTTHRLLTDAAAGMTNPMTTGGDIIYGGALGVPTRLANGTAGQVLTSQGTTLAPIWSAAGAGDMVLASVQTVTGAKTFGTIGGAVGKLILAGSTSGSSILDAAAVAGTTTITLPGTTTTLAGLSVANSFTTAQAITPTSDVISLAVRRNGVGQAANILEIQTEANAFLAGFDKTGKLTTPAVLVSGLTASEIVITDASSNLISAAVATYPSLTELSYVKGVTSGIQAQLNTKGAGTVTAVSVATANGVSGSSSGGATPALTITLGAITPTTVNGNTLTTGSSTYTGTAGQTYTFPSTTKTIAANDGSNFTMGSQAIGDLVVASSTTAVARLADVAVGQVLVSGGVGVAPAYSANPQVTTIELGNASDTTLSRIAAGLLGVEGEVMNGWATTATAAGTTTLSITDKKLQFFTGTTTQNVNLPTTNVIAGQQYIVYNAGTTTGAVVTVRSSGSNDIIKMSYGVYAVFTALQATPTTAAHWAVSRFGAKNTITATSYTTDTGTSLNIDYYDEFIVTAQAGALLINNPSGTARDGQTLIIAITGTAARALTYGAQFEASTVALPTTTATTARLNMGFIWRADTSKWVIIASA